MPETLTRTVPTESVAIDAQRPYMVRDAYRETYLYTGQTVLIPRWANGNVLHWELARIRNITVTVDTDGVCKPWFSALYLSDGELWGGFPYSIADPSAVSA